MEMVLMLGKKIFSRVMDGWLYTFFFCKKNTPSSSCAFQHAKLHPCLLHHRYTHEDAQHKGALSKSKLLERIFNSHNASLESRNKVIETNLGRSSSIMHLSKLRMEES